MGKKLELLRQFDLEKVKDGEPFGILSGEELKQRTYVAGPDNDGRLSVKDDRGNFLVAKYFSDYRMEPLGWVDERPVYSHDLLYLNATPVRATGAGVDGFILTTHGHIADGLLSWEPKSSAVRVAPDKLAKLKERMEKAEREVNRIFGRDTGEKVKTQIPPKAPPPHVRDLSLLRPLDIEAAKAGAPICHASGEPRKFVHDSDDYGMIGISVTDGGLTRNVYGHPKHYRMAPVSWKDGKPIYPDSVLYFGDKALTGWESISGGFFIRGKLDNGQAWTVSTASVTWETSHDGYVAIIPGNAEGAWHSVPGVTAVWSLYHSEEAARHAYPNAVAILGPVKVPPVKRKVEG